VEGSSKVLDKLAEVDTFVGNVVEDSFVSIALIFYVTNLHLQT